MKKKAYWGIVRETTPDKTLTLDMPRDPDKEARMFQPLEEVIRHYFFEKMIAIIEIDSKDDIPDDWDLIN